MIIINLTPLRPTPPPPTPLRQYGGQECSLRWKLVTLCPGTAVKHAHSPSKCQQHMTRHMPASAHKNIVVAPSAPGGRGGNTRRRARGKVCETLAFRRAEL